MNTVVHKRHEPKTVELDSIRLNQAFYGNLIPGQGKVLFIKLLASNGQVLVVGLDQFPIFTNVKTIYNYTPVDLEIKVL